MLLTSYKVCDRVSTERLEKELNKLSNEGYDVYRLEWVLNTHTTQGQVPILTRWQEPNSYISPRVELSNVVNTTTDSGYWIIVAIKSRKNRSYMGFFIFVFILLVLGAIGFFGGRVAHSENPKGAGRFVSGISIVVAILAILVLTVLKSFHTVDNGHIGIVKSFGNLVSTTGSGIATTAPWQTLAEVSVRNELRVYDMGTGNSAVSADSQPVFLTVQVNYSLIQDKAVSLYVKTGGDYVNRILDPAVYQYTKEVTAEYKATDFAANREAIRVEIEKRLNENMKPQGIIVNSVSLKNVDFTPDLKRAIEQTVEANQQAKRENARVQIVKAQADQAVAQAKGTAEATLTQARADAEANRLKNHTLTPLLVQKAAIDKLNPNVKVIVCPTGTSCVPQAVLATAGG